MRKGFAGLAALIEKILRLDPYSGQPFVFRGRRGDLIKMIGHGGTVCSPSAWNAAGSCGRRRHTARPWSRRRKLAMLHQGQASPAPFAVPYLRNACVAPVSTASGPEAGSSGSPQNTTP